MNKPAAWQIQMAVIYSVLWGISWPLADQLLKHGLYLTGTLFGGFACSGILGFVTSSVPMLINTPSRIIGGATPLERSWSGATYAFLVAIAALICASPFIGHPSWAAALGLLLGRFPFTWGVWPTVQYLDQKQMLKLRLVAA